MNDNNENKVNVVSGLLAEVADKINSDNTGEMINNRLRDDMVEREIAARVSVLDKAFAKRRELSNALNKVNRADNETFNADGTSATSSFSKPRLQEIKKAKEPLAKLEAAMEKALTENDFQKLKDLVK